MMWKAARRAFWIVSRDDFPSIRQLFRLRWTVLSLPPFFRVLFPSQRRGNGRMIRCITVFDVYI